MRLLEAEQNIIIQAVKRFDSQAEIWLYGSRAHDELKGGDIDLLVFSSKIGFLDKLDVLMIIKQQLGEQKIDLQIYDSKEKGVHPFVTSVLKNAVRLS